MNPSRMDQVEDHRDDGVDPGQLVVGEHEDDNQRQAAERGDHARPDRVGAESRADHALFLVAERGGQRT